MVNFLRRFSQPIMVVITVLVVVSFVWWVPNVSRYSKPKESGVFLFGKEISNDTLQRQQRIAFIYCVLADRFGGKFAMLVPGFHPFNRDERFDWTGVINSLIVEHEADALGITVTEEERIAEFERLFKLPNGDYRLDDFQALEANVLQPRGFTRSDLETIFCAGEVRLRKLRSLIGSAVIATPAEARALLIREQTRVDASYIAIKNDDFKKDVKVTDEELAKYYEEHKDSFKTAPKRKVKYAAFLMPPPPADKPLEESKRTELLQDLANKAYDFHQQLEKSGASFDELAKSAGATVAETNDFFTEEEPPEALEKSFAAAASAFQLTKEHPYSDVIDATKGVKNGAYVLMLTDVKESEQKSLADAKKEIEERLISQKAEEAATAKAKEIRPKIEEALKAGKSFPDAAKDLNLTVQEFPSFTGSRQLDDPIAVACKKLAPGEISPVIENAAADSALIVHLDYRSPVDEKAIDIGLAGRVNLIEEGRGFFVGRRDIVFQSWLSQRFVASGAAAAFAPKKQKL